jgi:hypothetical protein
VKNKFTEDVVVGWWVDEFGFNAQRIPAGSDHALYAYRLAAIHNDYCTHSFFQILFAISNAVV